MPFNKVTYNRSVISHVFKYPKSFSTFIVIIWLNMRILIFRFAKIIFLNKLLVKIHYKYYNCSLVYFHLRTHYAFSQNKYCQKYFTIYRYSFLFEFFFLPTKARVYNRNMVDKSRVHNLPLLSILSCSKFKIKVKHTHFKEEQNFSTCL